MDNPLWSFFFKPPKEKLQLISLLETLPIFESISQNDLIQIERMLHTRRYSAGELVFNEDEPGAAMYIIQRGAVVITKKVGKNDTIELATIGESSFFGELALLDEMPRSASAHAQKEATLLAFSKPDLEKLVERNPRLGARILINLSRLISQRLIKANGNMEQLQKEVNELKEG